MLLLADNCKMWACPEEGSSVCVGVPMHFRIALLEKKAALRICSQYFSCVTHLISRSLWDQLCVYVHYLVQFLWPSVIVSQGSAWSHGFLVVLQHLLSATMVCQNSQKIFFCFVVRTGATMMQEIGQSASERFHQKCSSTNNTYSALFNWPKNAALFSVAAYMYLYMRSLNFHRGWQCTLVL